MDSAAPSSRLLRKRNTTKYLPSSPLNTRLRCVLTIAGSDSGGGAGIQADLRTIAAFGLHGLSVITAVTAQNSREVVSIHRVPPREIERQLHALFADFPIRAVKIGMLGSTANIAVVADVLRQTRARHVVVDPVLVSSSGSRLLPARGLAVLREELIPLAEMLTPNLPEAEALLGRRLQTAEDWRCAARDLLELGAKSVLLKGGHGSGRSICDYFAQALDLHEFRHPRLPLQVHGTGCVLSSAIAANLARGRSRLVAMQAAQVFLQKALRGSYRIGKGTNRALRIDANHD